MPDWPTDYDFRKFKQPTYVTPEPYTPPETYPTKLLVHIIDESSEGTYKYWVHESGKTIRIFQEPGRPPRPPQIPLHEKFRQSQLRRERACPFLVPDPKRRVRQMRPPPTPTPTPTPTPPKQKQTWKTRWRRKPKPKKRPSAFKAWIIARAEAERKRKREARKKKREKIKKAITRYLPRVLTVNYVKEIKNYIERRRSKPPPTPPPISPCKSYCYPPLHPPPSPLAARLKFWKKVVEERIPPPGVMLTAELFERGKVPSSKGVQFERRMWKDAHAGRLAGKRPLHIALYSRSYESLVTSSESGSKAGGSFKGDVDQDSSAGNQFQSRYLTPSSCNSRSSSLFLFSFSSPTSSKPRHSRTDSSISSLLPIKESTKTQPTQLTESTEPKPYRYLLPEPSLPTDPTLRKMVLAFQEIRKQKAENPPPDYIACPIFNYQGTPLNQWAKKPLIALYISISFEIPYAIVEYLKSTYSWIPFFELTVDRILSNIGGEIFLFLMSLVTFACAMFPFFVVFVFVVFPASLLHNWFVAKFRRMPFYRFKYSLGFPGYLEEGESTSGGPVWEGEGESESESEGEDEDESENE